MHQIMGLLQLMVRWEQSLDFIGLGSFLAIMIFSLKIGNQQDVRWSFVGSQEGVMPIKMG
jgi:hypothetical protein